MEVLGQLHAPTGKRAPIIVGIGGMVCLRVSLDVVDKRKLSFHCWELNPRSHSLKPSHYTDTAILIAVEMTKYV